MKTGLPGGGTRTSIWSSRPSAGGGLDDEDCDDEDSIHSHTSEEREELGGESGVRGGSRPGNLPSGRITATTATTMGMLSGRDHGVQGEGGEMRLEDEPRGHRVQARHSVHLGLSGNCVGGVPSGGTAR